MQYFSRATVVSLLLLAGCVPHGPQHAKSEGFTGPVHQKAAGTIVFSKSEIPRAPATSESLVNEFHLADSIFLRTFLSNSPQNLLVNQGYQCSTGHGGDLLLTVSVNGGEPVALQRKDLSSLPFREHQTWPLASGDEGSLTSGPIEFRGRHDMSRQIFNAEVVSQLKAGENTLHFVSKAECSLKAKQTKSVKTTVAEGSIKIQVQGEDLQTYYDRVGPHIPDHVSFEKDVYLAELKKLAHEMIKEEVIEVRTLSSEWRIVAHKLTGRVLHREFDGVAITHSPVKRCTIHWVTFSQVSDGPDSFQDQLLVKRGEAPVSWTSITSARIPCIAVSLP